MLGQFGMALHLKWSTEATMDVLDKPLNTIFESSGWGVHWLSESWESPFKADSTVWSLFLPGWASLPLSTRYFCELRWSSLNVGPMPPPPPPPRWAPSKEHHPWALFCKTTVYTNNLKTQSIWSFRRSSRHRPNLWLWFDIIVPMLLLSCRFRCLPYTRRNKWWWRNNWKGRAANGNRG